MLAGEHTPEILAELAQGRMKGKREQLVQALQGTLGAHHRFLLQSQLRQVDFFDQQIQEVDQEIAHRLGLSSEAQDPDLPDATGCLLTKEETNETPVPSRAAESSPPLSTQLPIPKPLSSATAIRILDEVTGINVRIGEMVVAELGLQMDRFPDEAHLSRLCRSLSRGQDQCEQTAQHQNRQRKPLVAPGPH
jgi:transposase